MNFINALTSYAQHKKILPNEAYTVAVRTKPGQVKQNIVREKPNKTQKDPFAGLSTRELYRRRPMD
jgi:hypothetical protein